MTTCNCNNNILAYLKYSKPDDFCSKEGCFEWRELNICEYCNTKYCDEHLCMLTICKFCKTQRCCDDEDCIIIKCVLCNKQSCVNNVPRTGWIKMSNDSDRFACSYCHYLNKRKRTNTIN